jgi:acetylornithine/succinyldiaminopimelate/putrescine aminotransferase/predicted amino acid dehydrogenase
VNKQADKHDQMEEWGRGGRDALLRAGGLDVEYTQVKGDILYYDHPHRGPQEVIDLVGGFGATLVGHNHPELIAVIHEHFAQLRPVLVQGSKRGPAFKLSRKISQLLRRELGEPYEVMLLNTGTEATEAALKHARLEFAMRQQAFKEALESDIKRLRRGVELGNISLDRRFYRDCEKRLGVSPIDSVDSLSAALILVNTGPLAHPGFLVAIEGAFHGKTLGSLALTWNPEARKPFVRGKPTVLFLRPGEASLEVEEEESRVLLFALDVENRTLKEQPFGLIVAVFLEPIRGEGGIFEIEGDVVDVIRQFREKHPEVPVVVDEIQTGLGRTGQLFESLRQDLPVDYMALGKALGGGICKISALAIHRKRYCREFSLLHSSTFAEDELSSAVALRFLELLEEDKIPERCERIGSKLKAHLEVVQHRWPDQIKAVRGRGLMLGVEFCDQTRNPSNAIRALALEERLTVLLAGFLLHEHGLRVLPTLGRRSTLRIEPSAYLAEEHIPKIVAGFEQACHVLANANAHRLLRYLVVRGSLNNEDPIGDFSDIPERFDARIQVRSRVAFMGHMILPEHYALWDKSLSVFQPKELDRLTRKIMGVLNPHVYTRRYIRSATGAATELSFIGVPMTSAQIEQDMRMNQSRLIHNHVMQALNLARRIGCSVVGFGGYTSIVTRNLKNLHEDRPALTTGNALTVGMGHEAIKEACAELNFDFGQVRAAVCGGTGNIGRVHARLLACSAASLVIVGRKGSYERLLTVAMDVVEELKEAVKNEKSGGSLFDQFKTFYQSSPEFEDCALPVLATQFMTQPANLLTVAEDLDCLKDRDVIVSASNSAVPILFPRHIHTQNPVIICDIAVPGDVSEQVYTDCPNVTVILGGIVALPKNQDFEIAGIPLPKGQSFACMGETVVLGLSGSGKDFSRGHITTDQIREIVALAKLHGIKLAALKTGKSF